MSVRLGIDYLDIIDYIDCIANHEVAIMGSITIRNIDDAIKSAARLEAARNGRSMEAELRALLERTYAPAKLSRAARLRAMSGAELVEHLTKVANGAELELPPREAENIAFPDL